MKIKQTVTDRPIQLLAACLLASLASGVQADTSTAPSFSEPVRLQAQPLHAATEAAMKKGKAPMLGAEAATAAAGRRSIPARDSADRPAPAHGAGERQVLR